MRGPTFGSDLFVTVRLYLIKQECDIASLSQPRLIKISRLLLTHSTISLSLIIHSEVFIAVGQVPAGIAIKGKHQLIPAGVILQRE